MSQHSSKLKLWVGLGIILASLYVFVLGHSIHAIDPRVDRTAFIAAIWIHVGFATLLFVPVTFYLILGLRQSDEDSYQPWEKWVFRGFQTVFALKLITGPLAVWTRGSPWKVFDWFAIPSPMDRMDGPHAFMETCHALLGYPLIVFFGLLILVVLRRNRYQLSSSP